MTWRPGIDQGIKTGVLEPAPEPDWESTGSVFPMEAALDSVGRLVVPKALRDALGLTAGSKVDISLYGAGLAVVPVGRTARLVEEDGRLVAESNTAVTDDDVFGLLESIRR
jgi:AbrB family looped-hinge helix DNA binding protein